jgi:hypothetical protein
MTPHPSLQGAVSFQSYSMGTARPRVQGSLLVYIQPAPWIAQGLPSLLWSLLLPLELFFLRIEARTRSEPKWVWWCRWERASWNQSPVRIFSCPGSASEARSLLLDRGGHGCC